MSQPVSDSYLTGPFETWLSHWMAEVNSLSAAVETWSQNKLDTNLQFNFGPAQANLSTALSSFITNITAVTST